MHRFLRMSTDISNLKPLRPFEAYKSLIEFDDNIVTTILELDENENAIENEEACWHRSKLIENVNESCIILTKHMYPDKYLIEESSGGAKFYSLRWSEAEPQVQVSQTTKPR